LEDRAPRLGGSGDRRVRRSGLFDLGWLLGRPDRLSALPGDPKPGGTAGPAAASASAGGVRAVRRALPKLSQQRGFEPAGMHHGEFADRQAGRVTAASSRQVKAMVASAPGSNLRTSQLPATRYSLAR